MMVKRRFILLLLVPTVAGLAFSGPGEQLAPEIRQLRRAMIRAAAAHRVSVQPDVLVFDQQQNRLVPGVRCATHGLLASEHDLAVAARRASTLSDLEISGKNRIKVYVHVVHDGNKGMLSEADIEEQIDVLNKAFRDQGFKFKLRKITYTDSRKNFRKCGKSNIQRKIAKAVGANPSKFLNIYTCRPAGNVLGFAYLPNPGSGFSFDGVWLLHSTLPGGTSFPYDEGDTATHEVGHFLGLLHTFDGGCSAVGDRVDDTPSEAQPAYGCPIGRDTCSGGGSDPVENFMDYSDDACMNHFTPGQSLRMGTLTDLYRPGI